MARFHNVLLEFGDFGLKQARACAFGAVLLALILATGLWYPASAPVARYDFLFMAALTIQALLIATGRESVEEAVVIFAFHAIGTVMELFKTRMGSWSYPEASILHIGAVPLFSGFMYSAVGSYIARAARLFEFRFSCYPRMRWTIVLAALIYENFFTHHFIPDMRIGLFALTGLLFWRVRVHFVLHQARRSMPLLPAFFLVALFIWLGENLGTFSRIWIYPAQADSFAMVPFGKLGAWYLLMIVSFVLVSLVHRPVLAGEVSGVEDGAGAADGATDDRRGRQPAMG
jgi:uncharacterized membrane protein YoaT (DUF817 family)